MSNSYFEEEQYLLQLKEKIKSKNLSQEDLSAFIDKYEEILNHLKMSNDITQRLQENLDGKNSKIRKIRNHSNK